MTAVPVAILFLTSEAELKGGGEFYLRDAVKGLARSFRVVCGVPEEGSTSRCLRDAGAVIALIDPSWSRKWKFLLRNYFELWKAAFSLRTRGIRVVYANAGHLAPFAVRLAGLLKARCIVHVHDVPEAAGQEKFLFDRADKVLACSSFIAAKIQGAADPAEVIYNGVDQQVFDRKLKTSPGLKAAYGGSGMFLVGIMGTVTPKKGLTAFVRMAEVLAQRIPSARFLVFGSAKKGEESFLERLRVDVMVRGLEERFFWKGFSTMPQQDLATLDVLVVPSRFEAFGRVIPEAFSVATPVVATRCGGPEEIIKNGLNGLLCAVDDIDGLVGAVERLYREPEFRAAMVGTAYHEAIEKFGLDRMWSELERVIGQAISAKH